MQLTTAMVDLCFRAVEQYRPPEGVDPYTDANMSLVAMTKNALRVEFAEAQAREEEAAAANAALAEKMVDPPARTRRAKVAT